LAFQEITNKFPVSVHIFVSVLFYHLVKLLWLEARHETFDGINTSMMLGYLPADFNPTHPRKLISWQPLHTPRLKVSVLSKNAWN